MKIYIIVIIFQIINNYLTFSMSNIITSWKQLNEKYNVIFNEGVDAPLSELEQKIYNGSFIYEDLDLTNINTLIALSNYYMLTQNDIFRLIILNKLVEIGDVRGYANLGCYYFNSNRKLAVEYLEKATNMGNQNAKFNLVKHYIEINDLDNAKKLAEELENNNYVPVYMLMSQVYGFQGNSEKMYKYLGKGIEHNDKNCMTSLEMMTNYNFPQIKNFLSQLNQTPFVTEKIKQIDSILNGDGFMLNVNNFN